jgi:hypothetical protein
MRASKLFLAWFVWTGICGLVAFSQPQSPARGPASGTTRAGAQTSQPQIFANLLQLMRGTLFPASNVIFAAQNLNPADVPPAKDPSLATDPLANTYGKWQACREQRLSDRRDCEPADHPGAKMLERGRCPVEESGLGYVCAGTSRCGTDGV